MSEDRKLHQAKDPVPYYDSGEEDLAATSFVMGGAFEDLLAEAGVAASEPVAVSEPVAGAGAAAVAVEEKKPAPSTAADLRKALANSLVDDAEDLADIAENLIAAASEKSKLTRPLKKEDSERMSRSLRNGFKVIGDLLGGFRPSAERNYYTVSIAVAERKEVRECLRLINNATMEIIDLAADSLIELFGDESRGTTEALQEMYRECCCSFRCFFRFPSHLFCSFFPVRRRHDLRHGRGRY